MCWSQKWLIIAERYRLVKKERVFFWKWTMKAMYDSTLAPHLELFLIQPYFCFDVVFFIFWYDRCNMFHYNRYRFFLTGRPSLCSGHARWHASVRERIPRYLDETKEDSHTGNPSAPVSAWSRQSKNSMSRAIFFYSNWIPDASYLRKGKLRNRL